MTLIQSFPSVPDRGPDVEMMRGEGTSIRDVTFRPDVAHVMLCSFLRRRATARS